MLRCISHLLFLLIAEFFCLSSFYFVSTIVLQIEDSSSHVSGVSVRISALSAFDHSVGDPVLYLLDYILEQLYGGDGPTFWSAAMLRSIADHFRQFTKWLNNLTRKALLIVKWIYNIACHSCTSALKCRLPLVSREIANLQLTPKNNMTKVLVGQLVRSN